MVSDGSLDKPTWGPFCLDTSPQRLLHLPPSFGPPRDAGGLPNLGYIAGPSPPLPDTCITHSKQRPLGVHQYPLRLQGAFRSPQIHQPQGALVTPLVLISFP